MKPLFRLWTQKDGVIAYSTNFDELQEMFIMEVAANPKAPLPDISYSPRKERMVLR